METCPDPPSSDPLFTHKPSLEKEGASPAANPLCQNKGRVWGQDLRCTTTPMDLWPTRHSAGHSPSVLIVFICRHKYEWNFSRHHPDSSLVPKCSLFHLYPIPGIQMSSPCKYFLALFGKQPANETSLSPCCQLLMATHFDPRAHSPTWPQARIWGCWGPGERHPTAWRGLGRVLGAHLGPPGGQYISRTPPHSSCRLDGW